MWHGLALSPASTAGRWTEALAYAFRGAAKGQAPVGGLATDSSGRLYGPTEAGGVIDHPTSNPNGNGLINRLTLVSGAAPTFEILHTFAGSSDGREPQGGVLVTSDGVVHGTTYLGPDGLYGSVFRLTPPSTSGGTWTENPLEDFDLNDTGGYPVGPLVFYQNLLYGAASTGGKYGLGTVFKTGAF